LDLNLRNIVKAGVLGKHNKPVANSRRGDPNVHYAGPTATLSRFGHDRCEDSGDFGVNRDRLQLTFDAAERPESLRSRCTILGE